MDGRCLVRKTLKLNCALKILPSINRRIGVGENYMVTSSGVITRGDVLRVFPLLTASYFIIIYQLGKNNARMYEIHNNLDKV